MVRDKSFGIMLKELREKKNVTLEQLGAGLCDLGKLSRIENGMADAEKLLRDRLLDRLGVAAENYENFLYYREYKAWKERQTMVHSMIQGRLEETKQLLEKYWCENSMEEQLKYQFYLSIVVQIRRIEGAEEEEVRELFRQALYLTVQETVVQEPERGLLSIEEINLLLEYAFCNTEDFSLFWYEKLFAYVERLELDSLAMAKIYPKLVYYYCRRWKKDNSTITGEELSRLLRLCDRAIEVLQKGNRMFYLWELLAMKEQLLQALIDANVEKEEQAVRKLKEWKQTCINWYTTLTEVYEEYGVPKEMQDFCYIYVDREAYCIGDVIRIRRKMFGMTMLQLSDGICSERTISRLERNETEPHRDIVRELFERLNMPGEFCRKELVTGKPEVLRLFSEAKRACNERKFDLSDALLEQIRREISFEIPGNKQVILRLKLLNEWHRKRINKETVDRRYFVEQLKEILEETIFYKAAVTLGEKYLTQNKIACLQNMMLRAEQLDEEKAQCATALYELFEKQRKLEECFDIYELVMGTIASDLGNEGEYDLSDKLGLKILIDGLFYRRLGWIADEIYDLLWNDVQREKNQHLVKRGADTKKELTKCICLCEISGDLHKIPFYKRALEKGIE